MINYIYRLKRAKISKKSLLFLIPIATVFLFPNIRNSVVYIFVSSRRPVPVPRLFFVSASFPFFRFVPPPRFRASTHLPAPRLFPDSAPFPFFRFAPPSRFPVSAHFPVPVPRLFSDSASFPSRRLTPTRTLLSVDTLSVSFFPSFVLRCNKSAM